MADTVYNEKIVVSVTDQSAAALRNVQGNVDKAEAKLKSVSAHPWSIVVNAVDNATRMVGMITSSVGKLAMSPITIPVKMASMIPGVGGLASSIGGGIGTGIGMGVANAFGQLASNVGGAVIGMNANLETATLQFQTLMGNADDARKHVDDLFTFAKVTPFETQPVIDASRLLRTFGGAALDTMDNLTMVGDAAAATNSSINEVSFWVGRAYAAIQGGQPFGEAAMRLQELAILSPQTAQKLQTLQSQGAKADVIWKAFSADFGKFNGSMARQANTWAGLTSTFSDALHIMSAKAFAPLFEVAKRAVGSLDDLLSGDQLSEWATQVSQAVADMVTNLGDWIGSGITTVQAIWEAITGDPGALGVVYDMLRHVFGDSVADFMQPFLQTVMDLIPKFKETGELLGFAFQDLTSGDLPNAARDAKAAFAEMTGIDLDAYFAPVGDTLAKLEPTWTRIVDVSNGFVTALGKLIPQPLVDFVTNLTDAGTAAATGTDPINTFIDAVNAMSGALADAWHWLEQHKEVQSALAGAMTIVVATWTLLTAQAIISSVPIMLWVGQMYLAVFATNALAVAQGLLNVVMGVNPLAVFVIALVGLAGALIYAYNTSEDFRNVVDPILHGLGDAVNWLWQNVLQPAIPGILQLWDDLKNNTIITLETLPIRLGMIGADMLNGLIKGMTGVDVLAWIRENITDKIPQFIKDALGIHSPSTVMAGIGSNMMQGLIGGLESHIPDILGFVSNLSNIFGGVGGNVSGWIDAAIQATGVPATWAAPLAAIIQHESGGDPLVTNTTDVNAQAGNASVGLGQLTGTNRAKYTPAGLNPLDPIAEIIAMIGYIQDVYGSVNNVPGIKSLAAGGAYQPYDTGGVLPPGLTMAANNTGQAEYVLRPSGGGGMGGGLVFAPQVTIDARGATPGVADDLEARFNALLVSFAGQLEAVFGNMAEEGAPA